MHDKNKKIIIYLHTRVNLGISIYLHNMYLHAKYIRYITNSNITIL